MNKTELTEQIRSKHTFLCVGLDTDTRKLPASVMQEADPVFTFNKQIIDATAPYCVAYKPNVAFYESRGLAGWAELEKTAKYLRENYPNHFVIADAKCGDIGNTSAMYAHTFFEWLGVDAVTLSPYMGQDSVMPYLEYVGKWAIVLALTSNKGALDFQNEMGTGGERLFERVLRVSQNWADDSRMMYVVGATRGAAFQDVRRVAPKHFLLVPGVGSQGGSLEDVCNYGMTPECGLLVNSSRGIIYADSSEHYAEAAREQAHDLQQQMQTLLRQL